MEKVSASTDSSRARFSVATLGCKVNAFESEQIAAQLHAHGLHRVAPADTHGDAHADTHADAHAHAGTHAAPVCVINTCAVTAEAERQARQLVRRAVRKNPGARIVVTGCYAQLSPQTCAEIPGVDMVVGNHGKTRIAEYLAQAARGEPPALEESFDESKMPPPNLQVHFENRTRAFLQIQQGCDRGCTFCAIHTARGPSRSLPAKMIRAQAQKLIRDGHGEIVLCGVDIGAYGEDFCGAENAQSHLPALLKQLCALDGDFRVRISSIDPAHLTDELIECIAAEQRICPQLHLSLQSGCTLILKRMRRRATRELADERVQKLRAALPHAVLSADILVGFPTESDEHFRQTLDAVGEFEIAYPHVFAYSKRDGTPAARIPRQVPPAVRKQRAAAVRARGREVWREVAARQIGARLRVLVERRESRQVFARAANYFPVRFAAPDSARIGRSDWAEVTVRGVGEDALLATAAQ